ncbi:hypothetical protein ZWY2020_008039 [Hordeum vulgare]|nr:hypothetical protein ZWY2020_008039 [Hordeum vulgare]
MAAAPTSHQLAAGAGAPWSSLPRGGFRALTDSAPASVRFSVARRRAARLEVKAAGNIFGDYFQVATYGESHGGGVGCVISGCPPRIPLTEEDMQGDLDQESNICRCPDPEYAQKMIDAIDKVQLMGIRLGLGSPVFDKLEALLAKAMLSSCKGFEIGSGFAGTDLTGSEHNDEFYMDEGGNGGISNGETIYFKVAFKPTATIGKKQNTVTRDHEDIELLTRGRHDPCVVPRAVPMVETMAALVLMDQLMAHVAQCEMFLLNLALQEPIGSANSTPALAPDLA